MKYRKLGKTGLSVSQFALGTVNFGSSVPEKDATDIVRRAYQDGINLFDTSPGYPPRSPELGEFGGMAEEILGKAVKPFRDEVLIATKAWDRTGTGPNDEGLSRHHVLRTVEQSLRRLQTDYIDIYLIHRPDPETPLEETLAVLDDLVHSGKVRYIGCSNLDAWLVCKALWISDKRNLARFDCVEVRYNLITRVLERDLFPLCASEGLGVIAYNPLAAGLLAGGLHGGKGKVIHPYVKGSDPPGGSRIALASDYRQRYWHDRNLGAVEKLQGIARQHGHTPVQVAFAWLLANKAVTSVLTSVDFAGQLDQSLSALGILLTPEEREQCDGLYEAMLPPGWSIQMAGSNVVRTNPQPPRTA
ncbi:MAG: aldo/keto reductase [Chloroflexi bacterium]|nr:aldo/keto reductase [Chloroflexota bacterium]